MSEVARLQTGNAALLQMAESNLPELFVINLCASMTPMPAVPKALEGFEKYKLYQVSRQEDGRRRFRLRLGFFSSEADAEWVVNSVRSLYPAAFTGCLSQEDLRHAGEVLPPLPTAVHQAAPTAVTAPTVAPSVAAVSTTTVKAEPKAVSKPIATSVRHQEFSLATPAAAPASTSATAAAPAFHVGRGIEIPETNLELTDEYPMVSMAPSSAPTPASSSISKPSLSVATAPVSASTPNSPTTAAPAAKGPVHSAVIINPPKIVDDYVPILDTTLTIRTLTRSEADDPNRPKWFVVQLALSEQPINLDTMPKLDIFAAYRLYSVALMEGGSIRHALRLGFFRENVSAEAVMGYLKAFFPSPAINQISSAEHDRFAEAKPKVKPAEADTKVVDLQDKRSAPSTTTPPSLTPAVTMVKPATPAARPSKPATSAKRTPPPTARPQSFLSRLIGRQLD